jgi:hypothetical protein
MRDRALMQIKEPRTQRTREVSGNRVEVALTAYFASNFRARLYGVPRCDRVRSFRSQERRGLEDPFPFVQMFRHPGGGLKV